VTSSSVRTATSPGCATSLPARSERGGASESPVARASLLVMMLTCRARVQRWAVAVVAAVVLSVGLPLCANAQLASKFSSAILSGWSAGVGMSSGFEDGLQFVNGARVQTVSYGAGVNAAKLWRLRKDAIDASAAGGIVQYPEQPFLNQKTYEFGGGVVHTFSRFTSATVRAQASSSFINRSVGLSGTGVLLGQLIEARSQSLSASYQTQFRRSLTASMNGSIQRINTGTPGFEGGQFSSLGVAVGGQLNRETTLGAAASYTLSQLAGVGANLPVVSASLDHRRRSGLNARVSGGAAVGPGLDVPFLSRLFGSVTGGLAGRWGEVSVEAQRTIGQQFGLDSTSLQEINFEKKESAATTAGLGGFGGVQAGGVSSRQTSYSASTRYLLSRSMTVALRGFIQQQTGAFDVTSKVASLNFSYGWSQSRRAEPAAR
jgi:hypothetical protein